MPGPLGGDEPGAYIARPRMYEYNPPSVFKRYKIMSILFGGAILALLLYWFFVVRKMSATPYIKGVTDQVYIQDLTTPAAAPHQ